MIFDQPIITSYFHNNNDDVYIILNNKIYCFQKSRLKKKLAAVPNNNSIPHEVDINNCKHLIDQFRKDFNEQTGLNVINYKIVEGRTSEGVCGCKAIDVNSNPYLVEAYLYGMDEENYNQHISFYSTMETIDGKQHTQEQIKERIDFLDNHYYLLCLFGYENYQPDKLKCQQLKFLNKNINLIPIIYDETMNFMNDNGLAIAESFKKSWLA